jgi:formamidopyrimidine-DNA glycosylase
MPELPEVETTRRGIAPHIIGNKVTEVRVRDARLRWPISPALARQLPGQVIVSVERRAKYLLLHTARNCLLLHLGMSGNLRIVPSETPAEKHDHLDVVFSNRICLRLRDPRRFGAAIWTGADPQRHSLLAGLGPEPLEAEFDGDYLFRHARGRHVAIKQFIMDSRIVAGVGNIYASEALFLAGIHPLRSAGRISRMRYEDLANTVKRVLHKAIENGGTTLRDFYASDGTPGYFKQQLRVYGREGLPCTACGQAIVSARQGQRATYYCTCCQR